MATKMHDLVLSDRAVWDSQAHGGLIRAPLALTNDDLGSQEAGVLH